jgi:hypothetical protein
MQSPNLPIDLQPPTSLDGLTPMPSPTPPPRTQPTTRGRTVGEVLFPPSDRRIFAEEALTWQAQELLRPQVTGRASDGTPLSRASLPGGEPLADALLRQLREMGYPLPADPEGHEAPEESAAAPQPLETSEPVAAPDTSPNVRSIAGALASIPPASEQSQEPQRTPAMEPQAGVTAPDAAAHRAPAAAPQPVPIAAEPVQPSHRWLAFLIAGVGFAAFTPWAVRQWRRAGG